MRQWVPEPEMRKTGQLQQSGYVAGAEHVGSHGSEKGSRSYPECACSWHLWSPCQECKWRLRHHIFKYLKWLHKKCLFYFEEKTIKMMLMAKHKISILEFHRKAAGSLPCLLPLAGCPLPPPITAHLAGGGTLCARVQGKRCTQALETGSKGPGRGVPLPKYQVALWWQHRFLKGTIPLGLTGEEGSQPEASQKRVSLNGWGQGKSLRLGVWLWMRLWVTKIKSKKHWSEILRWQRSCLNFLCIPQYDNIICTQC